MTDVTMRQLLEVGVHFGHLTRFWCPKMSPYIYGHRNKLHIINLERTLPMFNDAMNYLSAIASQRGTIMFVGTKNQASSIIREQAQRANSPYVYHRWLGGMLTNHSTIRKSIDRLKELEDALSQANENKLSKSEALRVEREHFRLNRNLVGIRDMDKLPHALFVIDVKHENIAIKEANKLGIPVVAIVDTNCDPDGVDYVIPGNDDAISAIRLYCTLAADAILDGIGSIQVNPYQEERSESIDDRVVGTNVSPGKAAVAPDEQQAPQASGEIDVETPQQAGLGEVVAPTVDVAESPEEVSEADDSEQTIGKDETTDSAPDSTLEHDGTTIEESAVESDSEENKSETEQSAEEHQTETDSDSSEESEKS